MPGTSTHRLAATMFTGIVGYTGPVRGNGGAGD